MREQHCNAYCTGEVHCLEATVIPAWDDALVTRFWRMVHGDAFVRWADAREVDMDQWAALQGWAVPFHPDTRPLLLWLRSADHGIDTHAVPLPQRLTTATERCCLLALAASQG